MKQDASYLNMKWRKKMNNKKVAMLYSKINGVEKIRIYSGEGKIRTIEGKSISELAKENENISIENIGGKNESNKRSQK